MMIRADLNTYICGSDVNWWCMLLAMYVLVILIIFFFIIFSCVCVRTYVCVCVLGGHHLMDFRLSSSQPCVSIFVLYVIYWLVMANKFLHHHLYCHHDTNLSRTMNEMVAILRCSRFVTSLHHPITRLQETAGNEKSWSHLPGTTTVRNWNLLMMTYISRTYNSFRKQKPHRLYFRLHRRIVGSVPGYFLSAS